MIQFPISYTVPNRYRELHLNEEWTVQFDYNWYVKDGLYLSVALKTHREITSEKILISGKLSVSSLETREFSKFMNSQSSFLVELLVSKYHTNSSHTVWGVIIIAFKNGWQNGEIEKHIQPKSLLQLWNDFERLLDPQTSCFADMNLVCGNVSIPAHKVILSARSPVFAAMFKNQLKESQENKVYISDIDASVLQTMMIYIYTGKTSHLTVKLAIDLLVAADKYLMQDLKDVCFDFLKKNATLQHVLTGLVGGDFLPECLKLFPMDYISKKCTDFALVEETEEWKALKKESPVLAMEIMESFVKSRDK